MKSLILAFKGKVISQLTCVVKTRNLYYSQLTMQFEQLTIKLIIIHFLSLVCHTWRVCVGGGDASLPNTEIYFFYLNSNTNRWLRLEVTAPRSKLPNLNRCFLAIGT